MVPNFIKKVQRKLTENAENKLPSKAKENGPTWFDDPLEQTKMQCTYNLGLRRVHETTKYYTFLCACV
jgi:hypothetical protein